MILSFLLGLFVYIFLGLWFRERSSGSLEALGYGFIAAGSGFSTVIVCLILASAIGTIVEKHETGPEIVRLENFCNSGGTSCYSLRTERVGKTKTNDYYFFHKKAERGYSLDKVAVADNVTIVEEEERKESELRIYTRQFMNPSFEWIAINWSARRYEFFIPKDGFERHAMSQ